MWPFNKTNLQLPTTYGKSQHSALKTIFFWLWRLRYYLLLIYLLLFSVLFSMTQLAKYTFGDSDELRIELGLNSKPIYRAYDTKSISPLSEMLVKHRFSKLHPKLPKSLRDNLKPFYIRSKVQPNPDDITVSAFVTENRFEDLIRLAELWEGPISATLHIITNHGNNSKSYLDSITTLKKLFKKNQKTTNKIDVHLILGPNTLLPNYDDTNNINNNTAKKYAVPTNFHLNIARFFSRTEFIFFLDHDTWPYSSELHSKIKDSYMKYLEKNTIIILPTFVFINSSSLVTSSLDKLSKNNSYNSADHVLQFPNNRDELIHLVKDGKMALLDKGWELNNGPTCLDKFMRREDNSPYQLETYDFYYKPNFIVKKNGKIPWCIERFDDNKAACLLQMYLSGLNLLISPTEFLIKYNFNKNSHLTNYEESKYQKLINNRLYESFYKETCLFFAREYLALGNWKTQISAQVRKECRRVISSLGEGIVSYND